MRVWGQVAIGLLVLCLWLTASTMAYNDEFAERDFYCDMVKQGKWPDYREIAATECESVFSLRALLANSTKVSPSPNFFSHHLAHVIFRLGTNCFC